MASRILTHPAWPSILAVTAYAIVADAAGGRPCHEAGRVLLVAAVAVMLAVVPATAALARRRHPRPPHWLARTAVAGVVTACAVVVLWFGAAFSACFTF